MAYVDLNVFRPKISQYCQGASGMLIRQHVLDTIIGFCERTECLKKDASDFYFEEETAKYSLKFPEDRYVAVAIETMTLGEGNNSKELTRITSNELDHSVSNWRQDTTTYPTHFFLTDELNEVRVYPMPTNDIDDEVHISCIVRPTRSQTEVDEFLYEKWEDVIVDGTLSKLLMLNKASWYNAKLAKDFGQNHSRGIRRARKTTISGQGKYPGRVMPQSYGNMGNPIRRSYSWD